MIIALKKAFPYTIPVMIGYVFIGIAFGILLEKAGFNYWWAMLLGVVIYSGALQFVCITFFTGGVNVLSIVFISMVMNVRHSFYGLALLDKYRKTKGKKPYLMYALTDETFSLVSTIDVPEGVDKGWFYFFISCLHQSYWIVGSVLGTLLSTIIPLSLEGIEFSMTALFVVMFVEQMKLHHHHYSVGIMGIVLSALALFLVGSEYFIVVALLFILLFLLWQRKREGVR